MPAKKKNPPRKAPTDQTHAAEWKVERLTSLNSTLRQCEKRLAELAEERTQIREDIRATTAEIRSVIEDGPGIFDAPRE